MKPLGLYIHIPFCKRKCLYCDFCSFPQPSDETVARYVETLCQDLRTRAAQCGEYTVDTVFFGGGTPTFLSGKQLEQILLTVFDAYRVDPHAEITAECNPATADAEKLSAMRKTGFNRLSIGMQSAHDGELQNLGRIHTKADFERIYRDARRCGFENISVDVMSGIPGQTRESYFETLAFLVNLAPEHLSAYGLIVEEGTPFAKLEAEGRLDLPDEEAARAMYLDGIAYLASRGYRQYEISNFAKRGYESRHNLKYWNGEEYLGFGPAAYSDFGGRRFGNSRDLNAYLCGAPMLCDDETPDRDERENEYVMLRMRLAD